MKRTFRAILLAAIVGGVIGWLCAGPAEADHQVFFNVAGYGDLDSRYNPVIRELKQYGVFRWSYQEDPGAPNVLPAVASAIAQMSARERFLAVYDPAGVPVIASQGGDFAYGNARHGGCSSWAIGCVDGFPGNPRVVVDAGTMQPWPLQSVLEVLFHELFHTTTNVAEGYMEDYVYGSVSCAPLDDGGARVTLDTGEVVTGFHKSLMNCGLFNNQAIDRFMDAVWEARFKPRRNAGAAVVGNVLWYAATSDAASLIAVIADVPGSGRQLVALAAPCTAAGIVCGAVALPPLPRGAVVSLKAQNALYVPDSNELIAGVIQ